MTIDSEVDKLLQYFWPFPYPEHKPPIEVVFSNGLPESDHDPDHMIFQMPYHTFKTAIANLIAQEANKAVVGELDKCIATVKRNPEKALDILWSRKAQLTADKEPK